MTILLLLHGINEADLHVLSCYKNLRPLAESSFLLQEIPSKAATFLCVKVIFFLQQEVPSCDMQCV